MKNVRKALLFIPSAFTHSAEQPDVNPMPPLGLGYIAATMEKRGVEVQIVDCLMEGWNNRVKAGKDSYRIGLSPEQIEKHICESKPDIVGVNILFTTQRENGHEIFRLAKEFDKSIICIAGGAHPTVLPELVLSDENVDFVVLGEGDKTIIDLIEVIEGSKAPSSLDGVGYRENGQINIIPKTKFIEDLDSLPFPARHLMNMENYFGLKSSHGRRTKNRFSPIITSRGCPAQCTFCSAHEVWGKKFRQRSPENVIEEMEHLKDKYGIEEIMFEDDNVNLNPKRAEKIFDLMIEKKLNFVWDTPNGVSAWTLTESIMDKMKQSGCRDLNLAIETGNQYVMDNIMKKPVKLEKIKPLIEYARKIKLNVNINLILGMPGETESQMWDTFRLARDLGIYRPFISIATPYPGSQLYDICMEKGYLHDGFTLDDLYIRAFPISTEDWDSEQLQKIYEKGKMFLLRSFLRDRPLSFLFDSLKYMRENSLDTTYKKIRGLITNSL